MKSPLLVSILFISIQSIAQPDTSTFFAQQTKEYNQWLKNTQLAKVLKFQTQSFQKQGESFELVLKSNYNSMDSLAAAWRTLDDSLVTTTQRPLANLLFKEGAFLFDIMPSQFVIQIKGNNNTAFRSIHSSKGEIQDKMHLGNTMGTVKINIPFQDIQLPTYYRKIIPQGRTMVRVVTQILAKELKQYYQSKPSTWLYTVQVDTDQTFFNGLTYRVTCLKNEIAQTNYFEFIEVSLEVAQQQDQKIEVRLDIHGKYCGGLLCPKQQEKFYYSMEGSKYDSNLKSYTETMGKRINQWLSKL